MPFTSLEVMRWLALLTCFISLLACTLPEVRLAHQLVEEENWIEAVAAYRAALKKDPFDEQLEEEYRLVKRQAAAQHHRRGQQFLEERRIPEALEAFQRALSLVPSQESYQEAFGTAVRLHEARRSLQDGRKLQQLGRMQEALLGYERAAELDPSLAEALHGITAVTRHLQGRQALGETAGDPITLRFQNARLKEVFEIVARAGGVNVIFDQDVRDDLISIFIKDMPFHEALQLILSTNKLFARRVGPDTLLIVPDTKQKRDQYEDLKIRTFYLSNAKAKDMANLLRTVLETKRIYVNEEINAVVVRDEPEKLLLADRVIQANDRRDAEVLFDVEILEVNRNVMKEYGLNFSKQAGAGIFPPTADGSFTDAVTFTFEQLTNLGTGAYLFTFPGSFLLDFLKTESDAKTLAAPKLRVVNNEKATVNIGDRQPILLSTTTVLPGQSQTGAVPSTSTVTSIEFKDTGVMLTVEPTIHLIDEITLKLRIEVTRLGDRVRLQESPLIEQFRFGNRTAETTLNMRDRETVVLAGLIQEDDRRTRGAVAGLDEVPILGDIFSSVSKDKLATEVILTITPHIVRNVSTPSLDHQTFWSGTEADYSTRPLFSNEDAAPPLFVPSADPQSPSSPNTEAFKADVPRSFRSHNALDQDKEDTSDSAASEGSVTLAVEPTSVEVTTGQEVEVTLRTDHVDSLRGAVISLRYDPNLLAITAVHPSDPTGSEPGATDRLLAITPEAGQLILSVGDGPMASSADQAVARLRFRGLTSGTSPLTFDTVRSPRLESPNFTLHHGQIEVQGHS